MKSKIINAILLVLALVFVIIGVVVGERDEDTMLVVLGIKENTISDFSFLIGAILVFAACIIEVVRRAVNRDRVGIALIAGAVVFGGAFGLVANHILNNEGAYSFVKTLESPDGEHTVYYYDAELSGKFTLVRTKGICVLKRVSMFEYEKCNVIPKFDEKEVEWGDDSAKYQFYTLDYSTYGD